MMYINSRLFLRQRPSDIRRPIVSNIYFTQFQLINKVRLIHDLIQFNLTVVDWHDELGYFD